jgi:hypothetical protein
VAFLKWLDRHLWSIPVITFAIVLMAFTVWAGASDRPVLISALGAMHRQQLYSSLTGTAGSLLGFSIASVTILAAFGPRATTGRADSAREERLAKARSDVMILLLVTSGFLLALLISGSLSLAMDTAQTGSQVASVSVASLSLASVTGLLVSGFAMTLVVVERSRNR